MSTTKKPSTAAKIANTRRRDWRPAFLAALEDTGTVVQACKAAQIDRASAYRERQRNEQFALAWADVDAKVTDTLERVAVHRAVNGSDRLLEFLLKARKPDVYRESYVRVEHSGSVRHDLAGMSDEQLDELADQLAR